MLNPSAVLNPLEVRGSQLKNGGRSCRKSQVTTFRKLQATLGLFVISAAISWWALPASGVGDVPDLVAGTDDARGFRYSRVDAGTGEPARYNACEPIHYVVNPAMAPANGVRDIHTAFEMTGEASGLRFVYDGATDEVATTDRPAYQPDRYGERWAPILIAWSTDLEQSVTPEEGKTIGWGGSTAQSNADGQAVLVSGLVTLDAGATEIPEGFGGATWGQAMLHELGHVLGLDHYAGSDSVMNPMMGLRAAMWGPGDRAGLWTLGLGSPCLESPPLP